MSFLYPLKHASRSNAVKLTALAMAAVLLGACTIYKPPVTQGNIITTEQVGLLKVGMTRQQVQQTLGSPLLQDVFNTHRWDYIYRSLKSDGSLEQRVMTITFDADGKLTKWSGQAAPNQNEMSLKTGEPPFLVNQAPAVIEPAAKLDAQVVALGQQSMNDAKNAASSPSSPTVATAAAAELAAPAARVVSPVAPVAIAPPISVAPIVTSNAEPMPAQTTAKASTQKSEQPLLPREFQVLIEKKIASWRAAWLAKDITAYAAHYAADFAGDLANHATWLANRQRIIGDAANLSITLSDIKVIQTSHTEARAAFTQTYKSNQFSETGSKNLFLQRDGDRWLIVAERFIKQS